MQTFIDYYDLLALDPSADSEDIKRQYHRLAMQNHPDRGGTESTMRQINDAYAVLSKSGLRLKYDEIYRQYHNLAAPTRSSSSSNSQVNVKYTFIKYSLKDYLKYQLAYDLAWLALKILYGFLNAIRSLIYW